MVLAVAKEQAAALGVRVFEHYETGLTEEQAVTTIRRLFPVEEQQLKV